MKLKIIQLIPVVFLIALFSFSNPVGINSHMTELNEIGEQLLNPNLTSENRTSLMEQHTVHRDALVQLGGLERKTFVLKYLPRGSKRLDEFNKETFNRFKQFPLFPITEYEWKKTETGSVSRLTVWDTPERMRKWETFIKEFDVPQTK